MRISSSTALWYLHAVVRVEFRFFSGAYQSRQVVNDGSTWTSTNWFTISDAPHFIELDWRSASGAGATMAADVLDRWCTKGHLTGIDNDTGGSMCALGAVSGIDTGTRGTYFFDAFESRRQTFIGP